MQGKNSKQRIINSVLILGILLSTLMRLDSDMQMILTELVPDDASIILNIAYYLSIITTLFSIFLNYLILKVFYKFTSFQLTKQVILRTYLVSFLLSYWLFVGVSLWVFSILMVILMRAVLFSICFFLVTFMEIRKYEPSFKDIFILVGYSLLNFALTLLATASHFVDGSF